MRTAFSPPMAGLIFTLSYLSRNKYGKGHVRTEALAALFVAFVAYFIVDASQMN